MINFLRKNKIDLPECIADADLVVVDLDACLEVFPLRTGEVRDELAFYFSWKYDVELILDPLYPAIDRLAARLVPKAQKEAMQIVGRWEARTMPWATPRMPVLRLIRRAAAAGKLVAIVSYKMRYTAGQFVRKFGLAASVDAIIGGDDVRLGRPHPERLLAALGATGFSPRESVFLANGKIGYTMGKNAGVPIYSYEYALTAGSLLPSHRSLREQTETVAG
ncbi:MAG: HAD hydrolase-like protein [Chloroflexota bacterium]|nr:HAD hydrolase-like protein [Chloroflexota bacterium]